MLLKRPDLWRRCVAEALGTGLLATVVVGSGISAQRLSPGDVGLQLLENALATGAGLVALILAFGAVSGAHFNPVVTLADRFFGGLTSRELGAYMPCQFLGGCAGAVVANVMFSEPALRFSDTARSGGGVWVAEVVATLGLLLVVFGVAHSGRASSVPFAVGAYVASAYFFTSSTSFANPAVTVARTLTDTFAGIDPASAPGYVAFQLVGLAVAVVVLRAIHPDIGAHADSVVVPMESEGAAS